MAKNIKNIYYKGIEKDAQIEKISEEVSKIFKKESQNGLSIDINLLIKKIKNILEKFEMLERVSIQDDIIKKNTKLFFKNLKVNTIKKRQLLIEGYVIIMDFLEMLTNTSIDYRIYSINEETNKVYFKTFSKKEILQNLLPGSGNELGKFRLNTKDIDEKIQSNKKFSNAENTFIIHFENLYNDIITNDMQPGYTYGYMVHKKIIDTYGSSKDKMPKNLFNKTTGRYQQFNKGHIVEGLDISIFEAAKAKNYEELLIFNRERIKELFYTKNLNYDNVKGFKQGDNTFTNTQIKLTNADLMDYSTILTYLSNIYISLTRKNTNIEVLSDNIKYMFYEEINKNVEDNIKFFIDKKLNLEELDSKIF